ncbi:LSm family protein [Sutcliffiella halmapala]|uniref:hypothetical protein n=1 Tax=Sutcliffiella halmapala TaxID=79882 RepID=UPI00099561E0|nr:hypothetical protein [Sutcliffiella halmapala]
MTFADILRKYIGREIEVYLPNNGLLEGVLFSVGDESFTLQVRNGSYPDPIAPVTVFFFNVEGIRVLNIAV